MRVKKRSLVGSWPATSNHSVQGHDQILRERKQRSSVFLALVLFLQEKAYVHLLLVVVQYNRTATVRGRGKCAAVQEIEIYTDAAGAVQHSQQLVLFSGAGAPEKGQKARWR